LGYYIQQSHSLLLPLDLPLLARAAFEITVPTIARAALGGEVEGLKGVTENVIVGCNIPIGSGTVDLYMQVSKKK